MFLFVAFSWYITFFEKVYVCMDLSPSEKNQRDQPDMHPGCPSTRLSLFTILAPQPGDVRLILVQLAIIAKLRMIIR
jgi:hypothetical protein